MEFELNGYKLKLDGNQLYYWFEYSGGHKLKNPYWRLKKLTVNEKGYYQTGINGRRFWVHRIIYYAHNPEWDIWDSTPNNEIDHIDRNPSNNNISNLRVVTGSENNLNRTCVDNAKGWCLHKCGKYIVQFRNKYIGIYNTEQEAKDVYREIKAKYIDLLG